MLYNLGMENIENQHLNNASLCNDYYTPKQGRLPLFIADILDACDPVFTFERIMKGCNLEKYITYNKENPQGRIGYNLLKMLKVILFGFMKEGYASLRTLEDKCKTDLRYMYLMDYETPSYRTFGNFINYYLKDSIEDIFNEINKVIFEKDHVDLTHIYIDGSKFEANANKYTWVWKKATVKSRFRLYEKITELLSEINTDIIQYGIEFKTNTEYAIEYIEEIITRYKELFKIEKQDIPTGKGHRKSIYQRNYLKLTSYLIKLKEYAEKVSICGEDRNSYSKTDTSATFMRIKRDYMGNDQLLPAYNVQFGISDEYISVLDVNHYRADMDCFIPLMEKYKATYGFYPKYPVADAGYGSLNNYIYCKEKGMELYMKFPMYEKETKDEDYHNDPFRAVNFKIINGKMYCPNNKEMKFKYRTAVKGNKYGREEEVYECENCSNCPLASKCKKTTKNRTIKLNKELTQYHKEVIDNLNSIQGALLRMNRSIQSEGTFGIMKYDRWYKKTVRKGKTSVELEIYLVSIGHNLYKYHNKQERYKKEQNKIVQ